MRIFVAPERLVAGELHVTGDEHHYLGRVRRARAGDVIELVDGQGKRATATIERIAETETIVQVTAPELIAAKPPLVRALVPLIKGDRMDSCIEKLVEVGVDAIVVWPAERSVVRIDETRWAGRLAKYRGQVQAAARQSGRAHVPEVATASDLAAAIAGLPPGDRVVLDPKSDGVLATSAADVTIASGPEGGLTPAELDRLSQAGFIGVGLGPRVLRAETAPLIAIALIRATTRS
jgi:16S rRNA (uracil1498-N3)-methyltransferase